MKIAILGPKYSFTHLSAMKIFPNGDFLFCKRIKDIFRLVLENEAAQGVVPLENMLNGTVRETIMSLLKYKVKINKSYNYPIHHCIAAQNGDHNKIVSHPQALAQCSKFLEGKETVEHTSTSKAMQLASEDGMYAAIGAKEAAQYYGLQILQENIEDHQDNMTRFLIISNEKISDEGTRTSLMINPKEDHPGLLFKILAPFATQGVNLTKIESLPSGRKLGEYIFYIEIDANTNEPRVKAAVNFLKNSMEVYSFGSYEVSDTD